VASDNSKGRDIRFFVDAFFAVRCGRLEDFCRLSTIVRINIWRLLRVPVLKAEGAPLDDEVEVLHLVAFVDEDLARLQSHQR